jgi:thiol:disulfide interchange protein DsbC
MLFSLTKHRLSHRAAVLLVMGALVAPPALADAPAKSQPAAAPAASGAGEAALRKTLEQKFPGATIGGVVKTPYFGLYEVRLGEQIIYTDAQARYVVVGSIYDTTTKKNMTEARQRELNRVAFDSLPLNLAFKRVKGNGERVLAIFSDADCPFCARLEQELKSVDNVTIYTFLYPIDALHPDSARKSRMIWCAPDKVKAWDEFFANGALPDNKGDCDNPVVATNALGMKLRVTATPTLVFADGSVVPGALPAAQLENELAQAASAPARAATAKK